VVPWNISSHKIRHSKRDEVLKGSIPTSPIDVEETAETLYEALTLSVDERKIKAATVRQAVERSDLMAWIIWQIHDINGLLDRTFRNVKPIKDVKPMLDEPARVLAVATSA